MLEEDFIIYFKRFKELCWLDFFFSGITERRRNFDPFHAYEDNTLMSALEETKWAERVREDGLETEVTENG